MKRPSIILDMAGHPHPMLLPHLMLLPRLVLLPHLKLLRCLMLRLVLHVLPAWKARRIQLRIRRGRARRPPAPDLHPDPAPGSRFCY